MIFFAECSNDDLQKDWSEEIILYVSHEAVDYYSFENSGVPQKGINIREEGRDDWVAHPLTGVDGFEYEEGFEFELRVLKTHLGLPPMDGFLFTYKLIRVISRDKK